MRKDSRKTVLSPGNIFHAAIKKEELPSCPNPYSRGSGVALVTPMTPDGIDFPPLGS